MDLKPFYAALADRLEQGLDGIPVHRRLIPYNLLASQPALLVLASTMQPTPSDDGVEQPWVLGAELILYTLASPGDEKREEQILELVAKIDAALRWVPGEGGDGYNTTLGGEVLHARLAGAISIEPEPDVRSQWVTHIGVEMLAFPQSR